MEKKYHTNIFFSWPLRYTGSVCGLNSLDDMNVDETYISYYEYMNIRRKCNHILVVIENAIYIYCNFLKGLSVLCHTGVLQ